MELLDSSINDCRNSVVCMFSVVSSACRVSIAPSTVITWLSDDTASTEGNSTTEDTASTEGYLTIFSLS